MRNIISIIIHIIIFIIKRKKNMKYNKQNNREK